MLLLSVKFGSPASPLPRRMLSESDVAPCRSWELKAEIPAAARQIEPLNSVNLEQWRPRNDRAYNGMNNGREAAPPGLTALLQAWSLGDPWALERLTPIVYSELHRLAHLQMAGERPGHVLQPSAPVHAAFVRLMGSGGGQWENRRQFFAAAARLMRQVLVDFARAEEAGKRGGRDAQVKVFEMDELSKPRPAVSLEYMIAIDEALTRLEALDRTQAQRSHVELLRRPGKRGDCPHARHLGANRPSAVAARPCVPSSFVEIQAVTPEKHRSEEHTSE